MLLPGTDLVLKKRIYREACGQLLGRWTQEGGGPRPVRAKLGQDPMSKLNYKQKELRM
jgi:hypothetical protein